MSHRLICNTVTVTAARGKTIRTMQDFNEGYDTGFNACMMELRQLIWPERGSFDTVVQYLESYAQRKGCGLPLPTFFLSPSAFRKGFSAYYNFFVKFYTFDKNKSF